MFEHKNLIRIKNGGSVWWLEYKYITEEIYLEAVKQNISALDCIPLKFKTLEFCLAAVRQNNLALQHVPCHLQEEVLRLI